MKRLLIGITGGSGSGKTSFIRDLSTHFPKSDLCIISQDDYYRPEEEQVADPEGVTNFDLPNSIDAAAFVADVDRLASGKPVSRPEYTFNNAYANPKLIVLDPAPIIIVEGLFVFYLPEMRNRLNLKIYLHAKENLKVIRRIKRDRVERNYPLEDVLYRYENHVLPAFERYIRPFRDEADIVVNNNQDYERALTVMKGYLAYHLQQAKAAANR